MNKLTQTKRVQIIAALVEGNSIRATCRMTGAAKGTVLKLVVDLGNACAAYHSLEALLADPAIDIAVNLTIFEAHAPISMQALNAGKHVYSEKPLALNVADAQQLLGTGNQGRGHTNSSGGPLMTWRTSMGMFKGTPAAPGAAEALAAIS